MSTEFKENQIPIKESEKGSKLSEFNAEFRYNST